MEYIIKITLITYVVIAVSFMVLFAFTINKEKQKNGRNRILFPFMMITSVLWPIIIMFLILRIDKKDKKIYDNSKLNKEKHK